MIKYLGGMVFIFFVSLLYCQEFQEIDTHLPLDAMKGTSFTKIKDNWQENKLSLSLHSLAVQSESITGSGVNLTFNSKKKNGYENTMNINLCKTSNSLVYKAQISENKISMDGNINKQCWKNSEKAKLLNYMGDKPKHFPDVTARIAYDDEGVIVLFIVNDRYVKAVHNKYQGPVCLDSCVEFFFIPNMNPKSGYFNFEVNCGGTVLFHYRKDGDVKYISGEDVRKINVYHSMPRTIEKEIEKPVTWVIEYKIPYEVLENYTNIVRPQPGVCWLMNLYKCADECSHPHWLTWSPVDYPTPKFHLPEYFGVLEFQ